MSFRCVSGELNLDAVVLCGPMHCDRNNNGLLFLGVVTIIGLGRNRIDLTLT